MQSKQLLNLTGNQPEPCTGTNPLTWEYARSSTWYQSSDMRTSQVCAWYQPSSTRSSGATWINHQTYKRTADQLWNIQKERQEFTAPRPSCSCSGSFCLQDVCVFPLLLELFFCNSLLIYFCPKINSNLPHYPIWLTNSLNRTIRIKKTLLLLLYLITGSDYKFILKSIRILWKPQIFFYTSYVYHWKRNMYFDNFIIPAWHLL